MYRFNMRLQRSSLSWRLIEKCIERGCLQGAGWELRRRSPTTAHSKRSTRARPGEGAPSVCPPHHPQALLFISCQIHRVSGGPYKWPWTALQQVEDVRV